VVAVLIPCSAGTAGRQMSLLACGPVWSDENDQSLSLQMSGRFRT
jgi:hypothetical protein